MGLSRNRWILTAGVTGTALAVVVAGAVAANAAQEKPAAGPAAAPSRPAAPSAEESQPAREPARKRLGAVVDAGFAAKRGAWVIYAVPVKEKSLPRTHFGVMAGRRLSDGTIVDVVVANEFEGSDRAPGFHAVQGGMEVEGERTPSFGYYAGDAARITARAGGRTVVARQAAWSLDGKIKFFWFDPATKAVSDLKAYDGAGRVLTAGNNQVGVG
ncbi:hypothetical protein [Actinoplanes sp. NPDC026623]|uniref:hypothetical protein n=1 Tax=Actinoplanes sp. NPDC026623 TaxID=3155610 RepID=UPI0033C9CB6B